VPKKTSDKVPQSSSKAEKARLNVEAFERSNGYIHRILWVTIFGIAMAYIESAVFVYLQAIFYPESFAFLVEVFRETATIFMLLSVAYLAGKKLWERFAYFMLGFGIWDIFYYVWLKVLLDWPASMFTWDVLYLIPLPWIGPVIAPVSISVLMIVFSIFITRSFQMGQNFRPTAASHILALAGIIIVLYSFLYDIDATLHQQMPKPYKYELLIIGDTLFIAAFMISYLKTQRKE
jgi:hypothetical protein